MTGATRRRPASTPGSRSPRRARPRSSRRSGRRGRTTRRTPTTRGDLAVSRERPLPGHRMVPGQHGATALYMNDRAGKCPGNARHGLNLGHDKPAEIVDVFRFGPDDHVVWPGDVLRLGYTREFADANGDLSSLADLCLNENVRLHHAVLPGLTPGFGVANATLRACCQARVRSPGGEKTRFPAARGRLELPHAAPGGCYDHLRPRRIRVHRSDRGRASAQ